MTWTYGSVDLSTFGVITKLDDSFAMPERRGDNILLPYQHGRRFVPKFYDERVMSFGIAMWRDTLAELETAIDDLHELLSLSTQQTLTQTRADASVRNALASVDKPLQVARKGRLARVVIEFTLADPFFYGPTLIADNTTTIDASPKTMVVANPGTEPERNPVILLTGPLEDTELVNTANTTSVKYTGVIAAGQTVTIQTSSTGEYTAVHSTLGNVIGNLTHSGSAALLVIDKGNNSLQITDGVATTGTVRVSFYPPYM